MSPDSPPVYLSPVIYPPLHARWTTATLDCGTAEQPNPDAIIQCIPGLEGPTGKPKYEPVVAGELYAQMLESEIPV